MLSAPFVQNHGQHVRRGRDLGEPQDGTQVDPAPKGPGVREPGSVPHKPSQAPRK